MSFEELVYKLRTHSDPYQTMVEAADKLEDLTAQLLALRKWRQEYVGKLTIAEAALAEKVKEVAALREALREAADALDQAREDVACWGSYAGEYFQDKHDLEGDLDRLAKQASASRRALGDKNDE